MKNLQKLGKALNKAEQKSINGGKKKCIPSGSNACVEFGRHCAEQQCRLLLFL